MTKTNTSYQSCILIDGNLGLLASHVAVQYLLRSDSTRVHVMHRSRNVSKDFLELVQKVTGFVRPAESIARQIADRLEGIAEAPSEKIEFVDQAWYFAGGGDKEVEVSTAIHDISALLCRTKVAELNCVVVPFARRASSWLTEADTNENAELVESLGTAMAELCRSHHIGYRLFMTAMLLAPIQPSGGLIYEGLAGFTTALYELKREIDARYANYFKREPLRYVVPAGATLNLLSAHRAGKFMMHVTEQPGTLNDHFFIGSLTKTPFAELCHDLSSIYDLSLLPIQDPESLNDIDRLFRQRVRGFEAQFSAMDPTNLQQPDCMTGEDTTALLESQERAVLLEALFRSQNAAWETRKERVAAMPGSLNETTIIRNNAPLLYYSAGESETPIILINALGQGLFYWYPLVDYLEKHQRVIFWEQRGTMLPPYPFRLTDQLSDLEAIIEHEGIKKCYLVAWCTGLKIAMAFHLLHPQMVGAMVILNGSLHTFDTPRELETVFEHDFGPVCRVVDETPRMAASVRRLLASSLEDTKIDLFAELPAVQVAGEVLSRANADLKSHIMAPFRTETATVNYCRQILDFRAYDPRQSAGRMDVPVIFIGAEHDKLVSTAAVEYAAKLFPYSRYLHVQGATHYFLYDQVHVAGELIERVFSKPHDWVNPRHAVPVT